MTAVLDRFQSPYGVMDVNRHLRAIVDRRARRNVAPLFQSPYGVMDVNQKLERL